MKHIKTKMSEFVNEDNTFTDVSKELDSHINGIDAILNDPENAPLPDFTHKKTSTDNVIEFFEKIVSEMDVMPTEPQMDNILKYMHRLNDVVWSMILLLLIKKRFPKIAGNNKYLNELSAYVFNNVSKNGDDYKYAYMQEISRRIRK